MEQGNLEPLQTGENPKGYKQGTPEFMKENKLHNQQVAATAIASVDTEKTRSGIGADTIETTRSVLTSALHFASEDDKKEGVRKWNRLAERYPEDFKKIS